MKVYRVTGDRITRGAGKIEQVWLQKKETKIVAWKLTTVADRHVRYTIGKV